MAPKSTSKVPPPKSGGASELSPGQNRPSGAVVHHTSTLKARGASDSETRNINQPHAPKKNALALETNTNAAIKNDKDDKKLKMLVSAPPPPTATGSYLQAVASPPTLTQNNSAPKQSFPSSSASAAAGSGNNSNPFSYGSQQNAMLRTIRSDKPIGETLPSHCRPNLNIPPPNYAVSTEGIATAAALAIGMGKNTKATMLLKEGRNPDQTQQKRDGSDGDKASFDWTSRKPPPKMLPLQPPPPPYAPPPTSSVSAATTRTRRDDATGDASDDDGSHGMPPRDPTWVSTSLVANHANTTNTATGQKKGALLGIMGRAAPDYNSALAPVSTAVGNAGHTSPPPERLLSPLEQHERKLNQFGADGASVDDLLELIEEFWAFSDDMAKGGAGFGGGEGSPRDAASPTSPNGGVRHLTQHFTSEGANWGDQQVEEDGLETPDTYNFAGLTGNSSPASREKTLTPPGEGSEKGTGSEDSRTSSASPPQALPRRPLPQQQHTLPDVVATVDGIKRLILAPLVSQKPLSLLAHRIGPTLLLEGTDSDASLTVDEARRKALRSKLLYYSVLMTPPSQQSSPPEAKVSLFSKAIQWKLSDMNILLGATQPTLLDRDSGQEVNLQMHEVQDLRPSPLGEGVAAAVPQLIEGEEGRAETAPLVRVGTAPGMPRLDQASALEYWLDNVLSNVSSVALCYHRDGDVQGYQVVPTHHVPQLSDPAFAPMAVQTSSTRVLKWLKEGTSNGGTSFVVVKEPNSTELKLFDITDLSKGGEGTARDMLTHPDARSRSRMVTGGSTRVTPTPTSPSTRTTTPSKRVAAKSAGSDCREDAPRLDAVAGALVPFTGTLLSSSEDMAVQFRGGGGGEGGVPRGSSQFKHLKYPYAMMCFRMAQHLPTTEADAFKLWQHVASLLSIQDDESLLPLAFARVGCMEYFSNSSQPDADRQAITQASKAVQALHALDKSIKSLLLPPSVLKNVASAGQRKRGQGGEDAMPSTRLTQEDVAQLLEEAIRGDADVHLMVDQMRQLCVRVVVSMLAMGERELKQPVSLSGGGDATAPPPPAVVLGRVVENILVAQAALMLRAFEVPSGLILANPDHISISSEVSSLHHALGGTAGTDTPRPQQTLLETTASAANSDARSSSDEVDRTPSSGSHRSPSREGKVAMSECAVLRAFERIATLSGDVVASHLQHVLDCATADAAAASSSPSETQLHRYMAKLVRDLKVTFSVMSGIASTNAALHGEGPPPSSIIGAHVPDHANFVGRMTPLESNPITAAETALSFYQQALGHNHALPGRRDGFKALHRKVAAIHAVVAEFYARGLMGALVPKDGAAMSPGDILTTGSSSPRQATAACASDDTSLMEPWRDSQDAYTHFDRAATAFICCHDFGNAALNLLNASKMCLRAAQALTKLKAMRQQSTSKTAQEKAAAAAEDNAAIEDLHTEAITALIKADQLPAGGGGGVPPSIADNVRQFTFSVYIFAFQWTTEQLTSSPANSSTTVSPTSAAFLSSIHDRLLAPALKIPKRLAHLMPPETLRSMEAKVLSLMIGLYWTALPSQQSLLSQTTSASASAAISPSTVIADGPIVMSLADRVACVRFAKTRLRQFWTNYVHNALSSANASVPLALWLEGANVVNKMVACDLFLFTYGKFAPAGPSKAHDSAETPAKASATATPPPSAEALVEDQLQCIERAFTSIADWRPWLKMAESGRVIVTPSKEGQPAPPSAPQQTGKKKDKQKASVSAPAAASADSATLLGAAAPIAKHLTATLMGLLKLVKGTGGGQASSDQIVEAAKKCLSMSTAAAGKEKEGEVSRVAWLVHFGKCLEDAEKVFNGRRSK